MAIKSTIFKADLQVTDTDRDYYEQHKLTLARHPSETDERMMVRLLVFGMHADPALELAGGVSTEDTPALWRKNLSGEILDWIDIGHPDEKRIRKACARARNVFIYSYGLGRSKPWWQSIQNDLGRFDNLSVLFLPDGQIKNLAQLAERTMQLYCTIQDSEITFADGQTELTVTPEIWLKPD
ncbi:YaeQ family protein [Turneriella parva]|uniref:YaeQ family protein n=1 Tax=Turneriella parva (strain ATCC BAA-1111 / DSM 21527 / NCTC 11395 / H) TaxID=869212 RepID=I4B630_TURPD|nr:YaeQ family protein [Turneriella parva]AFM12737.1 YaeQ family protein [Turneriella parva DSM 21527]